MQQAQLLFEVFCKSFSLHDYPFGVVACRLRPLTCSSNPPVATGVKTHLGEPSPRAFPSNWFGSLVVIQLMCKVTT